MNIGTLLRKLRDSKRLSSRDIAKKIDVSHSTYMDWEHDRTSPSLKSYLKLSLALDLNPVELMSYFTEENTEGVLQEEKTILGELREIVINLRRHNVLLMESNEKVMAELSRIYSGKPGSPKFTSSSAG